MPKARIGSAAIALLSAFAFVASAQAATANFTSSNVTSPTDPTYLFQNLDTNPDATITVSGTTNWTAADTSNLFDVDCYSGNTDSHTYAGPPPNGQTLGDGIPLNADGSFSVSVPEADFASGACQLIVVPHGTTPDPGTSFTGPRVGFSYFETDSMGSTPYDFAFDDVTTAASAAIGSIDDCGPVTDLVDGTSAMNAGPYLFYCAGSLYNSAADYYTSSVDLTQSGIQIDGQNAYGSVSAAKLFDDSDQLSGFPALTASLDSFDSSDHDAQTTESESLVKCTPDDVYDPTSSDCTAFASTGVAIQRVADFSDDGRVTTVTDTFTSTDGQAHSLDLEYETDLGSSTAEWQLPGQSSFSAPTGTIAGPTSAGPATVYAIYDDTSAPSLDNPVGALTFAQPYNSVTFDDTLWVGENSALFDYQRMVPAGGSTSITWSYATGSSLAEVQGYATSAQAAMQSTAQTASAGSSSPPVSGTGDTATAAAAVSYAKPAKVSLESRRFNGKQVLVKLACAASGSACKGTVTASYTETVVEHHKKRKQTVVVASKRYSIGAGKSATVSAGLSGTGRRLLKAHGRLAVKGAVTVTESGIKSGTVASLKPALSFELTLKQPAKKRK